MNILRYAFKNIIRNLFLSISSVMIIALLVFFVNILLLVLQASDEFIRSVNDRIAFTINFRDGYNDSQIRSQEFLSGMTMSFSGVRVDYVSRDAALSIFALRNPDLFSIIEDANDNPLPDSVRISNVSLSEYDQVNDYIANYQDIFQYDESDMNAKLLTYTTQYNQVQSVVVALRSLNIAVYILIGLFLFTVFVVVHMIIRNFIFFLQDEIRIIELVGGKSSFIYGPFILQGSAYMIVALAIVFLIFSGFEMFGGIPMIPEMFRSTYIHFHEVLFSHYMLGEFLAALGIGIISSFLASYRYIHSTIGE